MAQIEAVLRLRDPALTSFDSPLSAHHLAVVALHRALVDEPIDVALACAYLLLHLCRFWYLDSYPLET